MILYHPLRKLSGVAKDYAVGKFDAPISIDQEDELGYLVHTMDFMAGALRDYDEDQRKLISNVSHDFRSPLTSIKGYIEAILDGTISPELQEKYLNIVLRETGIGIPKDSLKKIWERFYKTDLSRGKDKKGTRLGLAIVKEIIQLHGENIYVVSTEGVGTEFIFSLSKPESNTEHPRS